MIEIEAAARQALAARLVDAEFAARSCAFLEQVGYPGLLQLCEALDEPEQVAQLKKDAMGVDLYNVSCVFVGAAVTALVRQHGRLFLRNVRHGLYLLPASVWNDYGIGCPVDPSFALGGERSKNPYTEKIAMAARDGVEIDAALWARLAA